MVKDLTAVQWSPALEAKLEDMLIRNAFDFKSAAKEFQRYLNSPDSTDSLQTVYYKIEAKTLQIKWTDIEIRKHVMPQMQKEQEYQDLDNEEVEDDDLPPLDQMEPTTTDSDRKAPSPEKEGSQEEAQEENEEEIKSQIKSTIEKITEIHQPKQTKQIVTGNTPVFSYDDDEDDE